MSFTPSRSRLLGFVMLAAIAACDQWSKWALLHAMDAGAIPHEILPFFNLVLVHNHGISFGMFAQNNAFTPWLLTGMTSLVALALVLWLSSAREPLTALALGCIIGGAVGNIIDRVRFGSVTDFLDFHLHAYHWPAFNLADSSIFIGVVILVLISIVRPAQEKEKET